MRTTKLPRYFILVHIFNHFGEHTLVFDKTFVEDVGGYIDSFVNLMLFYCDSSARPITPNISAGAHPHLVRLSSRLWLDSGIM